MTCVWRVGAAELTFAAERAAGLVMSSRAVARARCNRQFGGNTAVSLHNVLFALRNCRKE